MKLIPSALNPYNTQKIYEKKVGTVLLRLVSLLGLGNTRLGGGGGGESVV